MKKGTHTYTLVGSWYDVNATSVAPAAWYDASLTALYTPYNGAGSSTPPAAGSAAPSGEEPVPDTQGG